MKEASARGFWILCAACGSDHASYDGPPQERVILDTDTTAFDW